MRLLAVFLGVLFLAGFGCSHRKAKPAPEPAGNYAPVPGVDAPKATASVPADRELKVVPFGVPATPPVPSETAPADTAATAPPVSSAATNHGNQKLIVTPDQGYIGKVATVNDAARFVIVTFPAGHVPPIDQTLSVYRHGLKVGELKVTEPQRDEFTAADVVTGDTAVGDEVRDK